MNRKADHVLRQGQTRQHACHWPGCTAQVPPAMWGCRRHWYSLPIDLRTALWKAYVPGQEITGAPSTAYVAAARAAQDWISRTHGTERQLFDPPPAQPPPGGP